MCHLILLMPVLALAAFWILPLALAIPLYAVVIALSAATYAIVLKSMHTPVTTGREGIIHAIGVVERGHDDMLEVRIDGEHWSAHCADEHLEPGDKIEVVSIDELTLGVTRYPHQPR